MLDNEQDTKTKWDLRQAKLELLGKLVQEKTIAYRNLIKNKNKDNLRSFYQEFQVVYKEVKQFANKSNDRQQQLIEDIDSLMKDLDDELKERPGMNDYIDLDSPVKTFRKLDKADDKLRELQMAVGLDLPLEVEREGYGMKDKTKEGDS